MELERIVQFMDELLETQAFQDYPTALNGLQVENSGTVTRVVAAVDASEATIRSALAEGGNLLLVHHGLFWGGLQPAVGPAYRKLAALVKGDLALYSAHLPLDAHPHLGNCALLAAELGIDVQGPFGHFKGRPIGWWGQVSASREELLKRMETSLGPDARVIAGGPEELSRVAVVTGGGATFLAEAAAAGFDALITGEAPHHAYHEALEMGVNLFLGGHYATETWGVRALASRVSEEFGVPWVFVDEPTGL